MPKLWCKPPLLSLEALEVEAPLGHFSQYWHCCGRILQLEASIISASRKGTARCHRLLGHHTPNVGRQDVIYTTTCKIPQCVRISQFNLNIFIMHNLILEISRFFILLVKKQFEFKTKQRYVLSHDENIFNVLKINLNCTGGWQDLNCIIIYTFE